MEFGLYRLLCVFVCVLVNVSDEESCSMSENGGLLLDNSCYVLTASSDMQQQQQAGVSWFKALSHCVSLGSSLASIDVNSTGSVSRLAEYLSSSGLEGQPLWIGLHRRPWVWIQRFDPGNHRRHRRHLFFTLLFSLFVMHWIIATIRCYDC